MKLYRTNYGLRATAVAVALTASLLGAWKFSEESRPPGIWIQWLRDSRHGTRETAAMELGQMGLEARSAVVPLADALVGDEQPSVRRAAARALTQILKNSDDDHENPAAIAALITALRDRDLSVRSAAVDALASFRPDPALAVPPLLALTKDADEWARASAISTLALIVPREWADRPEVVGAVVKGLADSSTHVRLRSMYSVSILVGKRPEMLLVAVRSPVPKATALIAEALRFDATASGLAQPVFEKAMGDDDPAVRAAAAGVFLENLHAGPALPSGIREGLEDSRPEVRWGFVSALARSGDRAAPWLPALQRIATSDPSAATRSVASSAITVINDAVVRRNALIAFFVDDLSRPDPTRRLDALDYLGRLGPDAASAIPRVTEVSRNDPDPAVAKAAAKTLLWLRARTRQRP